MKMYHDGNLKPRNFEEGQLILLFDSRKKEKVEKRKYNWLGPYKLYNLYDNVSTKFETLEGFPYNSWVNTSQLK